MIKETRSRTFAKTVTWRLLATLTTMTLVYLFTKKLDIAATVGGFELIAKMLFYYFHERAWNKINKGKKYQEPFVLWFTGLSGAGKSTLANAVHEILSLKGYKTERLDGDIIRGVFPKTGFDKESRDKHVRRVGFLASLLEKNGVIVLASFISPYRESREFVRKQCKNFIEVYISTSLEECEKRDVKGLYKKARSGEIKNFTGIDDPFEPPVDPEIIIDTAKHNIEESAKFIVKKVKKYL